jgi:ubiquinone/menaquinone biosynthesis C-methylase UbiE
VKRFPQVIYQKPAECPNQQQGAVGEHALQYSSRVHTRPHAMLRERKPLANPFGDKMEQNNLTHEPVDEDELIKSQMEKMVTSYDSYMRKITFGRERILRDETVRLAQVKPGDSVLEVGCGTGTLTLTAKRQAGASGKVFGIDIIPGMIEVSQRKAAQAKEDITFQLGSIDDIPFPADQFDVVMCSFMIFHMSKTTMHKGIIEVYRVLKPGGRLLVLDLALPTQPFQRFIAQKMFGGMLQHELNELLPLMETAGFSNIEIAQAKFRVMGLSVLSYVLGWAEKN